MDFSEFLDQGNSKKRYEERLRSLRSDGLDTANIESGTNAVIAKLQEGAKSLWFTENHSREKLSS